MPWRRLLPNPFLSGLLLALWLLLNDSLGPGHLLMGALLGVLIPRFARPIAPADPTPRPRLALVARLLLRVAGDMVRANFAVAHSVLTRPHRVRPVFVEVPLDIRGELPVTLLASIITLTPGTVSADVDADQQHILVHALDEDDPAGLVQEIKDRYEAPIREIFRC